MKIVLDTNVLVSGLLNPYGVPGEIVRLVASNAVSVCYDVRIICEYHEVLARAKFQFDPDRVQALIDQIEGEGEVYSTQPLTEDLPDVDDAPFLEVAIAGKACLVTGNIRHYPRRHRKGVRVMTPGAFRDFFRQSQNSEEPNGEEE